MTSDYPNTVFAFGNSLAAICFILVPMWVSFIVTGDQSVAEMSDAWDVIFYTSGAISVGGFLIFGFFGSAEKQPWGPQDVKCRERSSIDFQKAAEDEARQQSAVQITVHTIK